ncbi:LysR substrate-binding domain-containing protein [Streptomyces sp. WM6378]|uniref:LysR substrate-binding domain-containing protein n=1 Tax=Streptomyces sp. WM6378 TaxID=1415557 RepID=UPI0006AF4771|nr:LysR substrate-binding domain-containing protein [Streptomyces sp. WM6378]KOU42825.1 LysR family transcriptional regulator [Streptomyces sp. WM6378]
MELRQLRYFVAVVEEANFTRAAARLHVAQPGISAQIRQLERELGQPLLDRTGGSVTTTEAGEAALPHARAALAAVDAVRHTVDEFTGLLRGHVTIGVVPGVVTQDFDVAAFLADFHDAHPGVEITLTEDTSERMLAALLAGRLDIALAGLAQDAVPPGISLEVVVDEPLVAAVAPGDPLLTAGRTEVRLAELEGRPLISLPRGTGLRALLDRACAEAGIRPRIAFEAGSPQLLARLAVRGLGVAVLPASPHGAGYATGLRTLRITEPEPRGRIALAWRTQGPAGPAGRALLARLRAALAGPAPAGRTGPS